MELIAIVSEQGMRNKTAIKYLKKTNLTLVCSVKDFLKMATRSLCNLFE